MLANIDVVVLDEADEMLDMAFIGLDDQVEHHLFPRIPRQNLPDAARITRAWCYRHGLRYHTAPYLTALATSQRFMGDAWSKQAVTPEHAMVAPDRARLAGHV
ncbi:MAG TPA: fatty acid desaturase [Kofleriaceae bacterium]|nr:fatty acid desaturase [Kofleriaceae bacterium]